MEPSAARWRPSSMRVCAAVLGGLLVVSGLSACATAPSPASGTSVARDYDAPEAASPVPDRPPPVTLHLATGDLDVDPTSSCWTAPGGGGSCLDGALNDPVRVGSSDALAFDFPAAGWTFQADLRPSGSSASSDCVRTRTAVLSPSDDGGYALEPMGPAGTYDVMLFGRGPQGDWAASLRWTTTRPGPESAPSATTSLLWEDDGAVEGDHGFSLAVSGLVATPATASATVTLTAADGESTTFDAGEPDLGCPAAGTVSWQERGSALSARAAALGAAPFTCDVTLVLDGATYRATAEWPTDHVVDPFDDDNAPVGLVFSPALPAA